MLKKIISIMLCFVVIMSICTISASASDLISVNYAYTRSCSSDIVVSNTTVTAKSTVMGYSGKTTKIVIKQTLQKKSSSGTWTTIGTSSNTVNSHINVYSKKYTSIRKFYFSIYPFNIFIHC